MKHIKSYFQHLNEGAYIDPNDPDQVVLAYDNLLANHPEYDNEVLVTTLDKRRKVTPYIIDKYYALILPNESHMQGLSSKKIKSLDHEGRPKATMDLLKSGKIRGGQAALDNFLNLSIYPILRDRKLKYVCPLGSTGGLVKMMTDFFTSKYRATIVDISKNKYQTILDAVIWKNLALDLVASEKKSKADLLEDLIPYTNQKTYIMSQARLGAQVKIPYIDPITKNKVISLLPKPKLKIGDTKVEYTPQELERQIQGKQQRILSEFFGALDEAIDIPSTAKADYDRYSNQKSKEIKKILAIYSSLGNIQDPYADSVDEKTIGPIVEQTILSFFNKIFFQTGYNLRTSGTSVGTGARGTFKDKYKYSISFEEALFDCIDNGHYMLIIDDNMLSGTDLRNVDVKIQEIINNRKFSGRQMNDRERSPVEQIKMFVLYDMAVKDSKSPTGTRTVFKKGSSISHTISNDKADSSDFIKKMFSSKKKIPKKVVMSFIFNNKKQKPIPSMPKMTLDIDESGAITDIKIDSSKSQMALVLQYDPRVDPNNWKFPFKINDVIFDNNATFTSDFEAWATATALFVNGEKYGTV